MVDIRGLISSEKETKIISIVATILAVLQVVPLLYSVILYLIEGNSLLFSQIVSAGVLTSFIALTLYLVFRRKKELQNR
jgi:protein-S-isoprenylcysteine O-methyltransferase Ste14